MEKIIVINGAEHKRAKGKITKDGWVTYANLENGKRVRVREVAGIREVVEHSAVRVTTRSTIAKPVKKASRPFFGANKNAREEFGILAKQHLGMHPIEALAMLAQRSIESGDDTLAFASLKELTQYISPKLRSVEHTSNDNEKASVNIVLNSAVDNVVDNSGVNNSDIIDTVATESEAKT